MGILAIPQLCSSPPAPAEMPVAGPTQGLAVLGHAGQLALGGILVFFLTAALERPQRLYIILRKCLLTSFAPPLLLFPNPRPFQPLFPQVRISVALFPPVLALDGISIRLL